MSQSKTVTDFEREGERRAKSSWARARAEMTRQRPCLESCCVRALARQTADVCMDACHTFFGYMCRSRRC